MKKVGDGTRVLNFLVDTILYWILAVLLYKWWNFHVLYWGYMHLNFGWFFFGSLFIYYFIFELLFAKTPAKVRHQARRLGQDTESILTDLGYSQNDIQSLVHQGAIVNGK